MKQEKFDGKFNVIDWNYFFSGEYEKPDECIEEESYESVNRKDV